MTAETIPLAYDPCVNAQKKTCEGNDIRDLRYVPALTDPPVLPREHIHARSAGWQLMPKESGFGDYSAMHPGHHHGFFAFIGLLAIVAPFAAPFVRAAWSRYLYAVPLAYVAVGLIAIHLNINEVFGEMVKAGVPNPFSWHWGVFVLVLAAVVLAAQALKPAAK